MISAIQTTDYQKMWNYIRDNKHCLVEYSGNKPRKTKTFTKLFYTNADANVYINVSAICSNRRIISYLMKGMATYRNEFVKETKEITKEFREFDKAKEYVIKVLIPELETFVDREADEQ